MPKQINLLIMAAGTDIIRREADHIFGCRANCIRNRPNGSCRKPIKQKRPGTEVPNLPAVVSRGFEPRQTEPKTVVLPLHHETIRCFNSKALQR